MKKYVIALFLCLVSSSVFPQQTPYVILVSMDGFRWDYLNKGITPNLESIRNDGVSALSLRPAFPSKTFPNHLSIITGMYPEHHGIIANSFTNPFTGAKFRLGDSIAVRDAQWYLGEAFWETAARQGILTASYFWPGSEVLLEYRHPAYYRNYQHNLPYETRVEGVLEWLNLPPEKRPHFITMYIHETDSYGHDFGPGSLQIDTAIIRCDDVIGLLREGLNKLSFRDSINLIVLSDHGMTGISDERTINIEAILGSVPAKFSDSGPVMFVEPGKGNEQVGDADNEQILRTVYDILKQNENHYRVYRRNEVPEFYHFSEHPFIGSIVLIADLGWSLITNKPSGYTSVGNHGYDNNQLDMQGIFLAQGPAFKKQYHTGTLWNIDIYPMLCKIFGILPRTNIDGELERIGFILK